MAQKTKKPKKREPGGAAFGRRKERRFPTSGTYTPRWVAVLGMVSSVVLGAGVFGLWVLDPGAPYAAYLVALGGLGLGAALWLGPVETAVAVGDAGIAVEDGREVKRMPWYRMKSISIAGDRLVVQSSDAVLRFSLGANPSAAAWALKEAAERVPDVLDVDRSLASRLPEPSTKSGQVKDVQDDQLAGIVCANSKEPIRLEEDARMCPRCGQVYHHASLPARCVGCDAELGARALRA